MIVCVNSVKAEILCPSPFFTRRCPSLDGENDDTQSHHVNLSQWRLIFLPSSEFAEQWGHHDVAPTCWVQVAQRINYRVSEFNRFIGA